MQQEQTTILISRNPFARTELHKDAIPAWRSRNAAACGCDWCGQPGNAKGKLFEFSTESDGGRTFNHPGVFCSVSCFRSYHGE